MYEKQTKKRKANGVEKKKQEKYKHKKISVKCSFSMATANNTFIIKAKLKCNL